MSSGNTESSGGDDLSSLSGFFFYVFIVHPATAWILKPGRFARKKAIMYAIGFLAALAAIKTGLEIDAKGPNHYSLLGVTRSSNPLEIKRAYKKLSLELHPDKNPDPAATEKFHAVKSAYDELMDLELREVYNKFGSDGIKSNKRFDETQFFLELGVFYLTWGMMTFVLTLGKKSGDARQWILTGLIVMLVIEIALMTSGSGNPLPVSVFPQSTEYEAVWLLHLLFPAYMNGCRSMGSYLYVDLDAQARLLLLALQEQNKDVLLVLRDVQINVQTLQANSVNQASGHRLANAAASGTLSSLPTSVVLPGAYSGGSGGGLPTATPTGKLKELQEKLRASDSNVTQAVQQLKQGENKNSSMGFYAMIVAYIAFSYFSN